MIDIKIQYGYWLLLLTIILGYVSGLSQSVIVEAEDLSMEQDENVHVNMSRGLVHILNRMEKLEDELCEKKIALAHFEEQVKFCNATRDADQKYFDLKLSAIIMNLTSMKTNARNEQMEKIHQRCLNAGSRLAMDNLPTGQYFFSGIIEHNWYNAFTFCRSHDLELLSIESAEENEAVINKIKQIGLADKKSYWMSGTDQGLEGSWVWMSTGLNIAYNAWKTPQPDNWRGQQNCNLLWNLNNDIVWDDGNCAVVLRFVCELPEICKN